MNRCSQFPPDYSTSGKQSTRRFPRKESAAGKCIVKSGFLVFKEIQKVFGIINLVQWKRHEKCSFTRFTVIMSVIQFYTRF